MSDVDVRPEDLHNCATNLRNAAYMWGDAYTALEASNSNPGSLFGHDWLGSSLHRFYDPYGPKALQFIRESGLALIETGDVLDAVAVVYTEVDQNSAHQQATLTSLISRLG